MIYSNVQLFKALSISGGNLQYEDDLHKPLLLSGDPSVICSGQEPAASIARPIVPRNGQEFREMIIDPLKQIDLLSPPHFLRADTSVGTVYGWIDRVTPLHESDTQRSYRLEWHPDWWLTAQSLGKLKFGPGRFAKCASSARARPASSQPRYWSAGGTIPLIDDDYVDIIAKKPSQWAVMCRTKTDSGITSIDNIFWPLNSRFSSNNQSGPNLQQIFSGSIEELLGIDPEAILGFWVSPIRPYDNFTLETITDKNLTIAHSTTGLISAKKYTKTLNSSIATTDREKIVLTDPSGTEAYTMPWGITAKGWDVWADIGTNAAYLDVYLIPDSGDETQGAEGRLFTFPLPTLPVTGNAWSSYVYSGQREHDIAARQIQRDESAVNGITGIGTGAIGGAIAGSAVAPGIGTAAGLIGGAVSSAVGTGVSYLTSGKYDSRSQRATDKLASNQTAGMILTSGGPSSLHPKAGTPDDVHRWRFCILTRDPISLAEYDAEAATLGYDTDFLAADCSALISAGGPMRISDLQVITDLPNDAKTYISAIFQRGVYIDVV